jgi:hypothetical protein
VILPDILAARGCMQQCFFYDFLFFRPGGTTKTYPEANSSGCWMKSLKVDENGFKWMKNGQNE